MPLHKQISSSTLTLLRGDITEQDTEAIVNAANSSLLGGGGVDGAIHRAGGPRILQECRKIREVKGECPTGESVITGGGNLKARYVIHTVGPVWHGGGGERRSFSRARTGTASFLLHHTGSAQLRSPLFQREHTVFPLNGLRK